MKDEIEQKLSSNLEKDVPLGLFTPFKVGGLAKYVCKVSSGDDLKKAIQAAQDSNMSFQVIGSGSQLLVSDFGYEGLVIKNEISGIQKVKKNLYKIQSGTKIAEAVTYMLDQNLSGLEGLSGLFGTIGGGIYSNSGDFGFHVYDTLKEVEIFDASNEQYRLTHDMYGFEKLPEVLRSESQAILLSGIFECVPKDKEYILDIAYNLQRTRVINQKEFSYQGAFFKSVEGLEEYLKKLRVEKLNFNGARMILEPYNKLIHDGSAKAHDIWDLAHEIKRRVRESTGVTIIENITYIGDFSPFNK